MTFWYLRSDLDLKLGSIFNFEFKQTLYITFFVVIDPYSKKPVTFYRYYYYYDFRATNFFRANLIFSKIFFRMANFFLAAKFAASGVCRK